jgi:hypothetical protein
MASTGVSEQLASPDQIFQKLEEEQDAAEGDDGDDDRFGKSLHLEEVIDLHHPQFPGDLRSVPDENQADEDPHRTAEDFEPGFISDPHPADEKIHLDMSIDPQQPRGGQKGDIEEPELAQRHHLLDGPIQEISPKDIGARADHGQKDEDARGNRAGVHSGIKQRIAFPYEFSDHILILRIPIFS